MITSSPAKAEVAAAYDAAAGQIARARALVADGVEVDLTPIRPAIRDLCDMLKSMPKHESAKWLARLVELQHELARLGQEFARRAGTIDGSGRIPGEPGE
jgi:hypothetical protein